MTVNMVGRANVLACRFLLIGKRNDQESESITSHLNRTLKFELGVLT